MLGLRGDPHDVYITVSNKFLPHGLSNPTSYLLMEPFWVVPPVFNSEFDVQMDNGALSIQMNLMA